jgi:hypothetical protein
MLCQIKHKYDMEEFIKYIIAEKEWIFSGIGIFILGFFVYRKTSVGVWMKQKLKGGSTGLQSGGDININISKK